MVRKVMGFGLPLGTPVYCFIDNKPKLTRIGNFTIARMLAFVFEPCNDPCDEVYATEGVRSYWKLHPESHPHATLFIMLYKKLDIGTIP